VNGEMKKLFISGKVATFCKFWWKQFTNNHPCHFYSTKDHINNDHSLGEVTRDMKTSSDDSSYVRKPDATEDGHGGKVSF